MAKPKSTKPKRFSLPKTRLKVNKVKPVNPKPKKLNTK